MTEQDTGLPTAATIDPKSCYFTNDTGTNDIWHYTCDEKYYKIHDMVYLGLVVSRKSC